MVQLTRPLCKYIPEWYHLKKRPSSYFKRQSWFQMTRFYKNIGWSTFKNARNRYEYFLKGENFYAAERSQHRRDINRSRIAAACEEHDYKYQKLMSTLPKRDINLNLSSLARLSIYEPKTFKSIVDISREIGDGPLPLANFNQDRLDSKEDLKSEFVPNNK